MSAQTSRLQAVVVGIAAIMFILVVPFIFLTCEGGNEQQYPSHDQQRDTARGRAAADSQANIAERGILRPGIRFDPATTRRGDRIGELAVDTIDARRAMVDSTLVGTIRFDGTLRLSGAVMKHHDADSRDVCFEADSASASRMPRWSGDERRPWLCFVNTNEARSMVSNAAPGDSLTITIADFTIHRGFSDQVNSARLVDALRR